MANLHLVVNPLYKEKAKEILKKRGTNLSQAVDAFLYKLYLENVGITIDPEIENMEPLSAPEDYNAARYEHLITKYK